MKQEAMQKHQEEWFFLHKFDVDRVFSTIRRTDYLVLYLHQDAAGGTTRTRNSIWPTLPPRWG